MANTNDTHVPPTFLGPDQADQVEPAQRSRAARHDASEDAQIRRFAVEAARLCRDRHCEDVVVLDVRELSPVTDYIIIASGTSDRQIKAVAKELEDLGKDHDMRRFGSDADGGSTWIVTDFVDVVVHLFEPSVRAYYDLEMLWGDGKPVDWTKD